MALADAVTVVSFPRRLSSSPPSVAPQRPARGEWAQAALVAAVLAWTTVFNGGYGAWYALVTLCLLAALLLVHAWAWLTDPGRPVRLHPAGWLFLPFLVYAGANVLWVTPVPWLGWFDWLNWAQMGVVFWVVLNGIRSRRPRWALFHTLVVLAILEVFAGCYQRFADPAWKMTGAARGPEFLARASGTFSIPNSLAGFFLLLLPVVIALAIRRTSDSTARVWWGWVGAVLFLGLGLTVSRGAWLALAVALTVWPLVLVRGSWRRRVVLTLIVLAGIAVAATVVMKKFPQARNRFHQLVLERGERTRPFVWNAAWKLFREAPWFGTGAGSFNVRFEPHRPEGFREEPLWAHNEYLNTLSDYGATGFLLIFGAAAGIALGCARRRSGAPRPAGDPIVTGALGIGLLAFALQLLVDFHFKIPALALSAATLAAVAVGRCWPASGQEREDGGRRRGHGLAVVVVGSLVVAGLALLGPLLLAEAWRSQARQLLDPVLRSAPGTKVDARAVPEAQGLLRRATALAPAHAEAWADLAKATQLLGLVHPGRLRELGREAEEAANRALEVSAVPWEFWACRGVARNLQGRWEEAGRDFGEAVSRAPTNANAWYYRAEHLFRVRFTHEAGEAALRTCLRLDPSNPAALALRQRLATTTKAP